MITIISVRVAIDNEDHNYCVNTYSLIINMQTVGSSVCGG